MHEIALDVKVAVVALHDAERIDPYVAYAQKPRNSDGLLVVERQFIQRNSVHKPLLVLKGELQKIALTPAVTQCNIRALYVGLFRLNHTYVSIVLAAHGKQSCGQKFVATGLLPLSTGFVILCTLQ